jgi:hypothetical protein
VAELHYCAVSLHKVLTSSTDYYELVLAQELSLYISYGLYGLVVGIENEREGERIELTFDMLDYILSTMTTDV